MREIVISVRLGGSDPNGNPRLRSAIIKAKESNMPKDTLERAIKKGAGEIEGVTYEEFTYEGYGPDGVAILMDIMTDNKNRTAGEVRSLMTKLGGNLGAPGSVSFMFSKKGIIVFDVKDLNEDKAMEIGIDAGAEDIISEGETIEVITTPDNFENVLKAFDDLSIPHMQAEVTMIPSSYQDVALDKIEKVISLIERLEDIDDVQAVYHNLNIPEGYRG